MAATLHDSSVKTCTFVDVPLDDDGGKPAQTKAEIVHTLADAAPPDSKRTVSGNGCLDALNAAKDGANEEHGWIAHAVARSPVAFAMVSHQLSLNP